VSGEDLEVRRELVIPADELVESASRAAGPGGQHVNKANTRVTLRWSVVESAALTESQRRRLLERLASRLTRRGELVVHADRSRSRGRNLQSARERMAELVREALVVEQPRVATRPTRGSRERAREASRRRSLVKKTRLRVDPEDD
jgi:ribosome-associated protein